MTPIPCPPPDNASDYAKALCTMKQPADLDPYDYTWTPVPTPKPINQNVADALTSFTHLFMIVAFIVIILLALSMAHSFYLKEKERNARYSRIQGNREKENPR